MLCRESKAKEEKMRQELESENYTLTRKHSDEQFRSAPIHHS